MSRPIPIKIEFINNIGDTCFIRCSNNEGPFGYHANAFSHATTNLHCIISGARYKGGKI